MTAVAAPPAIRSSPVMPTPAALSYHDAVAALAERGRFGIRLGLGRTRALLRELGDPQLEIRGALVAGTNGKGSVIAMCGAVLRAAGLRVGETPKPHLVTYRERIVVDGRPISAADFARHVAAVLPAADRVARRLGPPTEFELLTAVVFRHFAEARLDVALVEVGLGGRLDATHAWDGGVAVVTNISLDHMDRLGSTIEAIAHEKAAIIMRGDLAVTGAKGGALAVVRRRAARLRVPLRTVPPAPLLAWDRDGIVVRLGSLGETRIGLRGRHQAANAAVADATLDALQESGIAIASPAARRTGYAAATWPGRLEVVSVDGPRGPLDVLLDGAHNPAGAAALARALDDLRPYLDDPSSGTEAERRKRDATASGPAQRAAPLTVVTATMADKDVDGVVRALASADAVHGARVIATQVGVGRALAADALAARWAALAPGTLVEAMPDPGAALDRAVANATGPIVVAGSLYLVGFARARLVDDPELSDPIDR